jgi:hypothetical protein
MWFCPKCGETVDDEFEICWACGTSRDGVEDPWFKGGPSEEIMRAEDLPAPPVVSDADQLVTVCTFGVAHEAYLLRNQLEAAGIPAWVFDENTSATFGFLGDPFGTIKVQVRQLDEERARQIIGAS